MVHRWLACDSCLCDPTGPAPEGEGAGGGGRPVTFPPRCRFLCVLWTCAVSPGPGGARPGGTRAVRFGRDSCVVLILT